MVASKANMSTSVSKRSILDTFVLVIFHIYSFIAVIIKPFLGLPMSLVKKLVERKLRPVGIGVNGGAAGDLKIKDNQAYLKFLLEGDLGAVESIIKGYMEYDGVKTFEKIFESKQYHSLTHPLHWLLSKSQVPLPLKGWSCGDQPGLDLFKIMLDDNMQNSCGYWKGATNLKEAQEKNMDLIAQKLKLRPGMKVLDLNCFSGGLAKYLAKNHGVSVVGFSPTKQLKIFADKSCKDLPVEIRVGSYLDLNETEEFDRIVSLELKLDNENKYQELLRHLKLVMKDDGILLMQEMCVTSHKNSPSLLRLPHHTTIFKALEDIFILEDVQNIGHDNFKTFEAWELNLEKSWPKLVMRYGDLFRKIWLLQLHAYQALLKSRTVQVYQIVLSKDGQKEGSQSYR